MCGGGGNDGAWKVRHVVKPWLWDGTLLGAPSGQVDEGEGRHPHRAGVVLVGALFPGP